MQAVEVEQDDEAASPGFDQQKSEDGTNEEALKEYQINT